MKARTSLTLLAAAGLLLGMAPTASVAAPPKTKTRVHRHYHHPKTIAGHVNQFTKNVNHEVNRESKSVNHGVHKGSKAVGHSLDNNSKTVNHQLQNKNK
jgi:hypothetical protein